MGRGACSAGRSAATGFGCRRCRRSATPPARTMLQRYRWAAISSTAMAD